MRGRKPNPIPTEDQYDAPASPAIFDPPAAMADADTFARIAAWRADAREAWNRTAAFLASERILVDKDIDALTGYCEAWATYRHARQQLELHGYVIAGGSGAVKSPYHAIVDKEWQRIKDFHGNYGMNAAARARLDMQELYDGLDDEQGDDEGTVGV